MDALRFNRASLINIGFLYAANLSSKFGHMAMHDIDLLPVNSQLKYELPKRGQAYHLASPKLHPKYHYDTFVGGILIVTFDDFRQLNGLSNKYWGWGLEDDGTRSFAGIFGFSFLLLNGIVCSSRILCANEAWRCNGDQTRPHNHRSQQYLQVDICVQ